MARRTTRRRKKRKITLTPVQAIVFSLVILCLAVGVHLGIVEGGIPIAAPIWEDIYSAVGLPEKPQGLQQVAHDAQAVHFIDVGQADSTLLQSGEDYCLVDAGDVDSQENLLNYLDQQGVTHLKLLVMSHPHADHIGSMKAVLEHVTVEQVLLPDFDKAPYPTTNVFRRVMETIADQNIPTVTAQPGQTFSIGQATLTVLDNGVETDNYNNISQVLYFDAPNLRVLLSGDGEKEVEQAALQAGTLPKVDVFKAAHHGSKTSNTLAFLQAIDPSYVVVSCGLDNSYGHPNQEALENYNKIGAQVFRTDQDGSVVIAATDSGLQSYTANAA